MSRANITWAAIQALDPATQEKVAVIRFAADHANSIGPFFYAYVLASTH